MFEGSISLIWRSKTNRRECLAMQQVGPVVFSVKYLTVSSLLGQLWQSWGIGRSQAHVLYVKYLSNFVLLIVVLDFLLFNVQCSFVNIKS